MTLKCLALTEISTIKPAAIDTLPSSVFGIAGKQWQSAGCLQAEVLFLARFLSYPPSNVMLALNRADLSSILLAVVSHQMLKLACSHVKMIMIAGKIIAQFKPVQKVLCKEMMPIGRCSGE